MLCVFVKQWRKFRNRHDEKKSLQGLSNSKLALAHNLISLEHESHQRFLLWTFPDAEFAFGIYDCDGSGKIDAYDIPEVLRALNTNPTLELCEKMGATKKRGEKKLSVEEFLPIYAQMSSPWTRVT